jgi:BlaR1 peptidase M56
MTAMHWMDINLMFMHGFGHGIENFSRLAASSFVAGLWQGVVLAAGAALVLRLVPKTTAGVRFAVWTAVFAVLALLPLLHVFSLQADGAMPGRAAVVQLDVRWSFAIAALWLMMSVVRAVRLAASAVRLRAIWKRATPVGGLGSDEMLSAAGSRGVELCTSADVDRPSVIGFFSPRILIPERLFEQLTAAQLEQIVLHEMGHLRRADDWINLLQKLGLVVVPLNPVLVWIERRLCFERELACDDGVLRLTKAPKAYATCLTSLAEQRLGRQSASLSLGAWERQSELSRRVYSILRGGEGMSPAKSRMVLGTVVLSLLGGAAELSRCPQFVSFSGSVAPLPMVSQTLDGTYRPVAFRGRNDVAAHETLLKASMPVSGLQAIGSKAAGQPLQLERSHRVIRAVSASQRVKHNRARAPRQWVVLTSWQATGGARMIMTVSQDQSFALSYAAVPTAGGWLVFQL